MTKVSVIIPVYNEEKVIGECLESLVKQTFKNSEIIVVDDGSTDNSKLKCQKSKLQLKTQNFQILEQKHGGVGKARNFGAKNAVGEILVFVDADMIFDGNFIKNLIAPIVDGRAIGTFSKDEYLANSDNIWARLWNINRGLPAEKMISENYPDNQKVFRAILKRKFDEVGGFDEKAGYTDDWSLSEKLGVEAIMAKGAKFYHKNPDNLKEVFVQSKWMAKRKYKLGVVGNGIALLRVSLPVSIFIAIFKFFRRRRISFHFIIFKIISDMGQFVGILEFWFLGRTSK